MAFSASSSSLPQPGQIFTVGSISWIINADGVGELLEPAQIDSAPITPSPATADPISEPPPRSPSSTARRPLPRYQRRQIDNDDLIASIDRVGLKLAIAGSALDTLVQRRPPSDPDLLEAARKTPGATALPFGFTNAAVADQVGDVHPPADQIADQPPPAVNMLHVGRRSEASLQTIPEENPDSESQGSTETVTETNTELLLLPPFRGGAIFNVSVDSPPRNGETEEERTARENRNVNRAQRRADEIALATAEQQRDAHRRPIGRNLDDEFVRVDGHDVYKTPSANLAVAANELARLTQTPEVAKVAAMLKAAHVQVNEIRQDQRPAYSTTSNRRSATTNRRQSRFADQHRDDRQLLQGGSRGNHNEHHRQHDQEVDQDARVHLNNLRDARRRINERRFGRHEEEVRRRQEYEQEYGNPDSALEPLAAGNAANDGADNPEGPPAFTRALRTLQWPRGFKITGVEPYEGRMNPTQWLQAYATAVRAAGGDTSVMANYLPVMLTPATMSWFTSLAPNSIGSWEELKKVFTDNYMATCTRPGTKHDLDRTNQKPSELLRSYIRRFSEMRNSIPNITEAEVITAFTKGLRHRELRSKFNRKTPIGISEMITTANQYADAEEAELRDNEDADTHRPTRRYDDRPNDRRHDDRRRDDRRQTTAATTTAVAIVTAAVIGLKVPSLAKIAAAGQTTSSPPSTNIGQSATTTSNTRRSSTVRAPSTRTASTE